MARLHDLDRDETIILDLSELDGFNLVNGKVRVRLLHKNGRRARLAIDADPDVRIKIESKLDKNR